MSLFLILITMKGNTYVTIYVSLRPPPPQAQRQGALLNPKEAKHLNFVLALPKKSEASLNEDLKTLAQLAKVLGVTVNPRKHKNVELSVRSSRETATLLNSTPKKMGFPSAVTFFARLPIGKRLSEKDARSPHIFYSESYSDDVMQGRVSIQLDKTDSLTTRVEKLKQFNDVMNLF